mgnify:CR=1 FL=1
MWRRRKKDEALVEPRNWRASFLGLLFALLAAIVSAAGAATLAADQSVKLTLVALSILAVAFESGALVWARYAKARHDQSAVRLARGLLVIAIVYTAGMQANFFGAVLLKPNAQDHAATGTLAEIEGRIASLEKRRGWQPAVSGTADSLSRLVADLKKDKTAAGKAKLLQAQADLSAAQALETFDGQIRAAHQERVQELGKPPADSKAALFHLLTGWDGKWVPYFFMALAVFFLQYGQVSLPVVAGQGARSPVQETPSKAAPVSDKSGNTGGGSPSGGTETGNTQSPTGDKQPFRPRVVSATGNGRDPDVSATPLPPIQETGVNSPTVSREAEGNTLSVTQNEPLPEPVEWPLEAEEPVTRPTYRELLEMPVTRVDGRETGSACYQKEPEREKKLRKRQTFDELYAKTDDIVTRNNGVMPDARALRKMLAPCQMRRALDVQKAWLADEERKRPIDKAPVGRHRGKRLGRGLETMLSAGNA